MTLRRSLLGRKLEEYFLSPGEIIESDETDYFIEKLKINLRTNSVSCLKALENATNEDPEHLKNIINKEDTKNWITSARKKQGPKDRKTFKVL